MNDIAYRWVVAPDDGWMVIVAELEVAPGQRLEAVIRYRDDDERSPTAVTPAVAERAIRLALSDGWTPSAQGRPPFQLADADHRVW